MNTIFKKAGIVAAISAAILLPSCSDDDATPKDETLPDITLSSSATSTTVWNTVVLTASATDDQGIDKIEIKIDGTSVGTSATSPYEFSWDTQKISDGAHTATAIVTDKSGNQKTAELALTVQNTLLEATVDADMLPLVGDYQSRGFIFLSDNDGKVIVAQEFHNSDPITLKAPAFDGSEFSVTEVTTYSSDDDVYIVTTTHVSRGKWVLNVEDLTIGEPKPFLGEATLNFQNMQAGIDYGLRVTVGSGITITSASPTVKVNLRVNPSLLYVVSTDKTSQEKKYNVFPSITIGTNTLDFSQVNKSMLEETITLPQGYSDAYIKIWGLRQAGNADEVYQIYNVSGFSDQSFTYAYPSNGFPGYYSTSEMYSDEYRAFNRIFKRNDVTPLDATLNATLDKGKFTVAAFGNSMDAYSIDIEQPDQLWTFIASRTTLSITIPEIPSILKDIVSTDRSEATISIAAEDYTSITGYDGLISYIRTSSDGYYDLCFGESVEAKFLTKEIDYTGGRKANGKTSLRALGRSKSHTRKK